MPTLSGSLNITGSLIVNTITSSFISGSITNAITASYALNATTASYAVSSPSASYAANATSASNALTASYVNPLNQNVSITGSLIVSQNLTVIGTSSFTYTTSSIVQVGSNTIQLNTNNPSARFGGLTVIDSGSFGTSSTGSLFWDSLNNKWVYSNPSGSTYDGGMLISGPRNTSGLGNETGMVENFVAVGQGTDHIQAGTIYNSGSTTQITGSLLINSSGTEYDLSVGSDKLFVSASGDVGIGTSSPLSYSNFTSLTIGDNSASKVGLIKLRSNYNSGDGAEIYQSGDGDTFINTNDSTTALFMSVSGSVGIGTITPTQKLTVATGNITADDYYFNNIPNIAVARRYVGGVAGISNADYTTICNVEGDALASGIRIALMGTAFAVVVNTVADILVNHSQDIYIESKSGIFTLLTLKVISNNDESFTIQATTDSATPVQLNVEVFPLNSETITFNPASIYTGTTLIHPCVPGLNISATGGGSASDNGKLSVSGNVGIGTTTPTAKLDMNGSVNIASGLGDTSTRPSASLPSTSTFGEIRAYSSTASYLADDGFLRISAGGGSNVGIKSYIDLSGYSTVDEMNQNIVFGTTGIEHMRINRLGNIGIGTTTPNAKLYVNGNTIITGSLNNGSSNISSGLYSHAEGQNTISIGNYSHAEGNNTTSSNLYSHAEGQNTLSSGVVSHAEGYNTTASGGGSHSEGQNTISIGEGSHVEGAYTTSSGVFSHSEGNRTISSGSYSHAEGYNTTASGTSSHTEGHNTLARGVASHAEGYNTISSGDWSHAEGYFTVASGSYQHVQGQFNISSSIESAFIVGNGTSASTRSNLIFAAGTTVQITGSLNIKDILVLSPRTTTPTPSEGMIIASGSAGSSILYYYNGTSWNALF